MNLSAIKSNLSQILHINGNRWSPSRLHAEATFDSENHRIYARTPTGPGHELQRYSAGSIADPRGRAPDWNRSVKARSQKSGQLRQSLRAASAELLREGTFHSLPIVDEDHNLVGIVTSTDLIRYHLDQY